MTHVVSCPICYENFKTTDDVYSTSCGHVYHFSCMQQWRARDSSCPQCREHNPTHHKVYFAFESDTEASKQMEEGKQNMETAQQNLKQMEKNNSEMQMELDERQRMIENLQREMEVKVTAISLLESKLEESEDKSIKLNSQLDESLFNGSRIEQELDLIKQELSLGSGDDSNNGGEIFHLKIQVSMLKSDINNKDEKIQNLCLEKYKLEEALKLAQSQMQSQLKNIEAPTKKNNQRARTSKKIKKPEDLPGILDALNGLEVLQVSENSEVVEDENAQKEIKNIENAVVIKGEGLNIEKSKYKSLVIKLAELMGQSVTENDLVNVRMMGNKHVNLNSANHKTTLCAEFQTHEQKVKFLSSKAKLRTFPQTKSLLIYEFNDDKVLKLYQYASVLRTFGYRVYCRDNEVYAVKDRRMTKINCSQQVHSILREQKRNSV